MHTLRHHRNRPAPREVTQEGPTLGTEGALSSHPPAGAHRNPVPDGRDPPALHGAASRGRSRAGDLPRLPGCLGRVRPRVDEAVTVGNCRPPHASCATKGGGNVFDSDDVQTAPIDGCIPGVPGLWHALLAAGSTRPSRAREQAPLVQLLPVQEARDERESPRAGARQRRRAGVIHCGGRASHTRRRPCAGQASSERRAQAVTLPK
jgi:hypothetical protein